MLSWGGDTYKKITKDDFTGGRDGNIVLKAVVMMMKMMIMAVLFVMMMV